MPEPPVRWSNVATAGRLDVAVRDRLGSRTEGTGAVFRLTNRGDDPLLVDLRSLRRVVRIDPAAEVQLPLAPAQVEELSAISALTQIAPGASITYAVPFACEGDTEVAIGGRLNALDGGRTVELVVDAARATLACDAPSPVPVDTMWVSATTDFRAAGARAEDFSADMPPMVRAASISGVGDVALLPFSYDALPIERWRYDACARLGTCPTRIVAQPPGSLRAPAVGMDAAGVAAFCGARDSRPLSEAEVARVADPARALVTADAPDVVVAGFRCARNENEPPAAP